MQTIDIERRYNDYLHDSFIIGCRSMIHKILNLSIQSAVYDRETRQLTFDIDEQSKSALLNWENKIQTHIEENYSDIII